MKLGADEMTGFQASERVQLGAGEARGPVGEVDRSCGDSHSRTPARGSELNDRRARRCPLTLRVGGG